MSDFDDDLAGDLGDVFFDESEFASLVEVRRTGNRCGVLIGAGLARNTGDRIVKSNYEIRVKVSDAFQERDELLVVGPDGVAGPIGYRLGTPAERDEHTVVFFADKFK